MTSADVTRRSREEETERQSFHLRYTPALDGLRGIAILSVMAFNGHMLGMQGGFVGVDIFFALSGFLITFSLVQGPTLKPKQALTDFYSRRALRLLPGLIALILACVAYALLIQSGEKRADTLRGVVYTLFYVANWAQMPPRPPGIGPLSHAWSLSVEEQFYIIWPLLLLLLLRLKSKLFILVILSSLVAISLVLNAWNWYEDAPYLRMYFGSDTRANELLIGCITALLMSWGLLRPASRLRWLFHAGALTSIVAILSSFFLVHYSDAFLYTGGFALVAAGTSLVIVDILLFPSGISHSFTFAPLVWIGRISYGLYLWHFPIFETARRLFDGRVNPIIYQIMALVVTFLVATVSYYFLELPFLKLRRRFAADEPVSSLQPRVSAAA